MCCWLLKPQQLLQTTAHFRLEQRSDGGQTEPYLSTVNCFHSNFLLMAVILFLIKYLTAFQSLFCSACGSAKMQRSQSAYLELLVSQWTSSDVFLLQQFPFLSSVSQLAYLSRQKDIWFRFLKCGHQFVTSRSMNFFDVMQTGFILVILDSIGLAAIRSGCGHWNWTQLSKKFGLFG